MLSKSYSILFVLFSFIFISLFIITFDAYSIPSLNYSKVKISSYNKTIAFVDPTFTYAAYQNGSFYNFYQKYSPLQENQSNLTITTDTYLLKDRLIPHGPFPYYAHPSYKDIPYKDYF